MTTKTTAKKIISLLAAFFVLAAVLSGCAGRKSVSGVVFAMDTAMSLTIYGANREEAYAQCEAEIGRIDALLSAENRGSDIARINAGAGGFVEVSEETAGIIRRSAEYSALTEGAFDITVYPLVLEWGFITKDYNIPSEGRISELRGRVGSNRIEVDGSRVKIEEGQRIELGAIAKGYLTDRISAILTRNGIERANISLGGNLLVAGGREDGTPWRVGLQDPANPGGSFGVLQAGDTAVITSGDYQRYFEENGVRYCHIIDPSTGYPAANGLHSVTVVTRDGVEGDALSTALFVMGREKAEAFWKKHGGFEMVLVEDGNVCVTAGIEDRFTLADDVGYTLHILS